VQLGLTRDKLAREGVETVAIVNTPTERARQYFQYRPTRVLLAADPDVRTHQAFGLPKIGFVADGTDPAELHWPERATMAQFLAPQFNPPAGKPRDYQIHVCTVGSRWEREHLLFRDFLRTHAEESARYEAIKYDVAGHHRDNRIGYMDAKQPFIAQMLTEAEDWAASVGWSRSSGRSRVRPPRRPPPRVNRARS
jgi:hypothetical protein